VIRIARRVARARSTASLAIAIAALFALPTSRLGAQPSPKIARAVRVSRAPRIDGRLDDAAWARMEPITDFVQRQPREGQAPTEVTEVFIAYDADALYVGARMRRRDMKALARAMTRRDGFGNAERFTVTFDPQMDRRTAVGFGVSAAGVRSDFRHTQDDDMRGRESQYDPVWTAATREDDSGWTAELRIPFSQLRFPQVERQRWGLQIDRWMPERIVFKTLIPKS
jgi:hypothetical protein